MGYTIKQSSAARPLLFLMVDSTDHVTGKAGVSPTVEILKSGGNFDAPAGAVSELGYGWYQVAGHATDTNTLGPLLLHAEATGADPVDEVYQVEDGTLSDVPTAAENNTAIAAGQVGVDAAAIKALVISGGAGDVEAILAAVAGVASVNNTDTSAPVVTFKKADGTTTKLVITYSTTDGTRTASVRS